MICLILLLSSSMSPAQADPKVKGAPASVRPVIRPLSNPAGERSQLPNLALGADGELYLSWVEPGEKGATQLRFCRLTDSGWTEPRTVASGGDWFVNWADFPSLAALEDGTLAAHWLGRLGTGSYSYGVRMSISSDHGKTWGTPFTPHSDRSATEHGFVSLVPLDEQHFRAVWLDGRAMAGGHGALDEADGHGGGMSIRTAMIDRLGQVTGEQEIDDRTCECCQTAAVVSGKDVFVAWRDRSDQEVRDIAWVRVGEKSLSTPAMIHDDGWNQEGCPVNGPALAVAGKRVAALWYTEAERPRVLFASSGDRGVKFSKPIAIDDGNPVGRVDLVSRPDGGWIACWLERGDEGGEIRVRAIGSDGTPQASLLVARTSTERSAGFPRIETRGKRVIIAWTEALGGEGEVAAPPRIHTAELVYPSLKKTNPAN